MTAETVRPYSLLTANIPWFGLVKCRLLWIRGGTATVEVTERKHPDFKHGQSLDVPLSRLTSRKGWFKQRGNDRLYYAGAKLDFNKACFVA